MLRGIAVAGAVILSLVTTEASLAASRVCRQLEAELASAGKGGGNSGQFKKYDHAVNEQRAQLATARSRARSAGCGLGFLSPGSCGPIRAQIDKMESNLAALERKLVKLAPSAKPVRSRGRILAALDANGCRGEQVAGREPAAEGEESDADLFARLFGGVRDRETLDQGGGPASVTRILNPNGEVSVYGPEGEFSTMCVRTCDGYYFPVSPSSSAYDFERDQKNCEATCPGTEVQLYYRPNLSDDTETMLSTGTGEPYSSLPTAYVYRDVTKPRQPACGCQGAAVDPNFSILGGETAEEAPAEPLIPRPVARPDPALDPETLANIEGKFDVATIKKLLKPKPVAAPILPPGERKVRVVGPAFLPDQEEEAVPPAPDRSEVR